ncbi:MAG TPA: hydrogen gas-evolving membrane-bound hydrogenase subunit E [Acidimicrobiia bacterium]|nr:hydrogen gas-evolving membrane-bound hydrogenase subunit E [Acidimicrobiia bacterium]
MLVLALGSWLRRRVFLVAAIAPAVTLAWLGTRLGDVLDGHVVTTHLTWVRGLALALDLRLDGFSATMTAIVAAVGVLVLAYAGSYARDEDPDHGRLAALLLLFAGAMVGLVLADDLFALYAFWEVTSITSYLLIGTDHGDAAARAAALHALLVTAGGGLAMLAGFVVLAQHAGTASISGLAAHGLPGGGVLTAALVLILVGAFTKSAQYPFHAWLPGAMAAPTPVSAYLHSATMVTAGVYVIARLAPIVATAGVWRPLVLTVGAVTLLAGGLRALRQDDLKLLLAFGTVSQLGLMVVLFGAGTPAATTAGWLLLIAHAAYKAALFMVVGVLDHETGTRDVRRMPALDARWRPVEAVTALALVSMVGVPLGMGFVAKESAYDALGRAPFTGAHVLLGAVIVGSMLTFAYGARFYVATFVTPRREGRPAAQARPSWTFVAPAAVLAIAGLVLGVVPSVAQRLATATARALGEPTAHVHLAFWHGWTVTLGLSALTIAGGATIAAFDATVQRVLRAGPRRIGADRAYVALLRGVRGMSRSVTGVVQNGSLPIYAGVVLAAAAVIPGIVLVSSAQWPGWPAAIGPVGNLPLGGLLVVAALGAAIIRQRFSAALLLGAVGYAMAGLFVVHGAPDLALTQAAVETLTTVLFVLVLRRLPPRFVRASSPRRRVVRLVIAALVGVTVFVFALVAAGNRHPTTATTETIARAVPDGGGRNVVNVILVDFRGFDTLGEITVLAVASVGAVALARAGRRPRATAHAADDRERTPRIVFVDVSAQVVFHAVLMGSLWLLFAGHNQPGGGFVGGLLAGAAIALRYVAGGIHEVRSLSRFRPWTVLGTGVLVAAATATLPLAFGHPVLDVATTTVHLPFAGALKLSTALLFDVGVYVAVVGMVLMVFEAFGDVPAAQGEAGP